MTDHDPKTMQAAIDAVVARGDAAPAHDPAAALAQDELEVRRQLAAVHADYQRDVSPLVSALTFLENFRPPAPVQLEDGRQFVYTGPREEYTPDRRRLFLELLAAAKPADLPAFAGGSLSTRQIDAIDALQRRLDEIIEIFDMVNRRCEQAYVSVTYKQEIWDSELMAIYRLALGKSDITRPPVVTHTIDARRHLDRIKHIIEAVDNRAMAADGQVTPTLQEMTQAEMSEIYRLAGGTPGQ